jgi:DNA (cytosine-5)-methyltransferase 1
MKYLSVCSGIEAATVAWHSLGWTPLAFSEIEKFPSQVLAHHYPKTPNLGDMTRFKEWNFESDVNVLVGGTPCQSFSVAGLRKGLDDPRGNLMLTYLAIAAKQRPKWVVWENVPGVLSSNGGLDFASFLRGLGQLGYGFAYRVLDAQYFGVAQRRRRVFVVGCAGDWRAAAAVLFERHSLQGHPAPSREKGQRVANSLVDRPDRGGGNSEGQRLIAEPDAYISPALKASDAKGPSSDGDGDGDGAILVPMLRPIALAENTIGRKPDNGGNGDGFTDGGPMYTLNASGVHGVAQPIPFDMAQITSKANGSRAEPGLPTGTLAKGSSMHVAQAVYELHSQDSRVRDVGDVCSTVSATYGAGGGNVPVTIQPIAFSRNDDGRDATHNLAPTMRVAGNAGGMLAAAVGTDLYNGAITGDVAATMTNRTDGTGTGPTVMQVVGFEENFNAIKETQIAPAMTTKGYGVTQNAGGLGIRQAMAVRRLTPVECERLQGFPDNYTDIQPKGKATPDGPRYKALGNSMAVPVMAWIGERIAQVEAIHAP